MTGIAPTDFTLYEIFELPMREVYPRLNLNLAKKNKFNLLKSFHPDKNPNQDTTALTQYINLAWDIIADKNLERIYREFGREELDKASERVIEWENLETLANWITERKLKRLHEKRKKDQEKAKNNNQSNNNKENQNRHKDNQRDENSEEEIEITYDSTQNTGPQKETQTQTDNETQSENRTESQTEDKNESDKEQCEPEKEPQNNDARDNTPMETEETPRPQNTEGKPKRKTTKRKNEQKQQHKDGQGNLSITEIIDHSRTRGKDKTKIRWSNGKISTIDLDIALKEAPEVARKYITKLRCYNPRRAGALRTKYGKQMPDLF